MSRLSLTLWLSWVLCISWSFLDPFLSFLDDHWCSLNMFVLNAPSISHHFCLFQSCLFSFSFSFGVLESCPSNSRSLSYQLQVKLGGCVGHILRHVLIVVSVYHSRTGWTGTDLNRFYLKKSGVFGSLVPVQIHKPRCHLDSAKHPVH